MSETKKTNETRSRDNLLKMIETFRMIGLPYEQAITAAYMQGFHSGRDMGIFIGKTQTTIGGAART